MPEVNGHSIDKIPGDLGGKWIVLAAERPDTCSRNNSVQHLAIHKMRLRDNLVLFEHLFCCSINFIIYTSDYAAVNQMIAVIVINLCRLTNFKF